MTSRAAGAPGLTWPLPPPPPRGASVVREAHFRVAPGSLTTGDAQLTCDGGIMVDKQGFPEHRGQIPPVISAEQGCCWPPSPRTAGCVYSPTATL